MPGDCFTRRVSSLAEPGLALKSTSAPSGSTAYMDTTWVLTDALAGMPTDPNAPNSTIAIAVASPKENVFIIHLLPPLTSRAGTGLCRARDTTVKFLSAAEPIEAESMSGPRPRRGFHGVSVAGGSLVNGANVTISNNGLRQFVGGETNNSRRAR
jgi:hypothetical protein